MCEVCTCIDQTLCDQSTYCSISHRNISTTTDKETMSRKSSATKFNKDTATTTDNKNMNASNSTKSITSNRHKATSVPAIEKRSGGNSVQSIRKISKTTDVNNIGSAKLNKEKIPLLEDNKIKPIGKTRVMPSRLPVPIKMISCSCSQEYSKTQLKDDSKIEDIETGSRVSIDNSNTRRSILKPNSEIYSKSTTTLEGGSNTKLKPKCSSREVSSETSICPKKSCASNTNGKKLESNQITNKQCVGCNETANISKLTAACQVCSDLYINTPVHCNCRYGKSKLRNRGNMTNIEKRVECKCQDRELCPKYKCRFCYDDCKILSQSKMCITNNPSSNSYDNSRTKPLNSLQDSSEIEMSANECSFDKLEKSLIEKEESIRSLKNEKVHLLVQVNNLHQAIQEMVKGNADLKDGIGILLGNVISKVKILSYDKNVQKSEQIWIEVLEALTALEQSLSGKKTCGHCDCNCMNVIKEKYSNKNKSDSTMVKYLYTFCECKSNTSSINIDDILELEVERDI